MGLPDRPVADLERVPEAVDRVEAGIRTIGWFEVFGEVSGWRHRPLSVVDRSHVQRSTVQARGLPGAR
ncbi:hypothetical protein PNP59_01650 [Halobacterium salinarum]|uniref:hypothetical protein n=1 Tax=Halobacterium salinarum TaxID=2242 RepID=UPI00255381C8|nr:hypothetical protein [Halobacterium salinarum]MDL0129640.1 hypothetical protein [Halobacterium salinarum]